MSKQPRRLIAPHGEATTQTVETRLTEGRIRTEIWGEGAVSILCLHGASAHARSWHAVAGRLGGHFRVYVPDLLSRGGSEPRPELDYGLDRETARIRELIERLGDMPRIIAGHSQGAAIALALAAAEPAVDGLVLASPVTPWTRRPAVLRLLGSALIRRTAAAIFRPLRHPIGRRVLARTFGPEAIFDERDVAAYCEPYAEPNRVRALMRVLADWDPSELRDRLPERPLAARVIVGAHDPRIQVADVERLAARLGVSVDRVPRGGHALPEQVPELVSAAIESVYEELGTRKGREER